MKHILLSVVIPAYNEADRIGVTLADLKRYFERRKDISAEIIVVSDGSTDDTAQVVREFAKDFPILSVIDNKENRGKGYAVKCGMLAASGAYRLFMDADNSVTIEAIEPFIEEMYRGGRDVIIGSIAFTYMPVIEHNGWHRRLFGSISKLLVRIVATPGIYDTQRGFKLFTKKAAEIIFPLQKIERFGFDIEILAIAQMHRLSIKELPVYWDNPAGSKVKLRAYLDSFIELGKIYSNMLSGKYDPPRSRGSRRRKAGTAILFLAEFPSLLYRFVRELLASKIDLDILTFSGENEKKKGKGFFYKGLEFISYSSLPHSETALYTAIKAQKFAAFLALIAFTAGLSLNPRATIIIAVSIAAFIYLADLVFQSYLIARSLRKNPTLRISDYEAENVPASELPTYTVLCPLYREWTITPQFLSALENLDYPPEKLEVILLLEEKDKRTRKTIDSLLLPENFRRLVVPDSEPRTKARAMNFGLERARGEYVVVYHSGDIPDPMQLRKAFFAFRHSDPRTISLQAKVAFQNPDENALTRIFSAEHSLWFDLTLPGIQSLRAPMPLAGTSNHFRSDDLRSIGGWDPFSSSEDWDLGIRIVKKGYKTAILESTTLEEANTSLSRWHSQRSIWVKGYMQTYLVHMRDAGAFRGGIKDLLAFQAIVGTKVFSLLVAPMFWLFAALFVALRSGTILETSIPLPSIAIGALAFVLGNSIYIFMHLVACTKRSTQKYAKYAFLVPLYRLGMSGSAWAAALSLGFGKEPYEIGKAQKKTAPASAPRSEDEIKTKPALS